MWSWASTGSAGGDLGIGAHRAPIRSNGGDAGSTATALVVLAIFVAVLYSGVLGGGLLFWSDTHLTFEPLFGQLGQGVRSGELLWNDRLETGKPVVANPTQAAFYPPNLLFALVDAPRALSLLAVLHVLIGALGAWALAERSGFGGLPALAAGVLFAGAGATLSATPYHVLAWCAAWLPWLLLFYDRLAAGERTVSSSVLFSISAFMMLTLSEPAVLAAAGLGVVCWMVDRLRSGDAPVGRRFRRCVVLPGLAGIAALVVAAPYLLAVLANLPSSVRALGFTYDGITVWSFHPIRLFELIAPGVFGRLGVPGDGAFWAPALVPVKRFFCLPSVYVGVPAAALVAVGVFGSRPRRTALVVWLAALLLLSFGRFGPIYPWLESVPGIDAARYPVKWLVPAVLPLCLLAAAGLRGLLARERGGIRLYVAATVAAGLALVAVMVAVRAPWFGWPLAAVAIGGDGGLPADAQATVVEACLRGLAPALAALIVMLAGAGLRLRPEIVGAALVAVVAADLATVNPRLVPTTTNGLYDTEPEALRVIRSDPAGVSRVRADEHTVGVGAWAAQNPPQVSIARLQRQTLAGYVAIRYGVSTALTCDTEATGPARVYQLRILAETAPPREQAMIYGSAAVSHLVTDRSLDDPAFVLLGTVRTVAGTSLRVYRNTLVRPRVGVVPAVIPYDGDDGYRQVLVSASPGLFSRATLVDVADLAGAPAAVRALITSPDVETPTGRSRARLVEDRGHRLTVEAETDRPAVLVVADAFLPQWQALVDGEPTDLLRVNYAFRGVLIPAGRHVVELTYHPWRRNPV